jgi:DNA-binding MarR family transcriptional regulator
VSDFYRTRRLALWALRRDVRLTLAARIVGMELIAWWGKGNPKGPIFRKCGQLAEILNLSEHGVRNAIAQLEEFGHFIFRRTGRASDAWHISMTEGGSSKFDDLISSIPRDRSSRI